MKLTREYYYESDFALEVARQKLREFFEWAKKDYRKSSRFGGLFTSDNEFEVHKEWQLLFNKRPAKKHALICGRLFQPDKGRLQVKLTINLISIVSPWYITIVPFILIPVTFYFQGLWSTAAGIKSALLFLLLGLAIFIFAVYMWIRIMKKRFGRLLLLRRISAFQPA